MGDQAIRGRPREGGVAVPTLFDDLPTGCQRSCPRCRRRKGQHKPRCVNCGAFLASPEQWVWASDFAWANVGLLKTAIAAVRPDIVRTADAAEIVAISLVSVVRALLGFCGGGGSKFTTYVAGGIRLAARRLPHGGDAATGVEWSRVESRAR